MSDEREQQIRGRAEAVIALTQLERSPLGWWPDDVKYLLDALAATRERLTECEGDARQMSLRTFEYDDEIERLEAELTAAREEKERLREVLEPLVKRCWQPREVVQRDTDKSPWMDCGLCPPCKGRAALAREDDGAAG